MIGNTLSHFRIKAKLGEGGMGIVYRAEDAKLGREVAIKVLPETVSRDAERLARFKREAQVLASLNHPRIASIHQVEQDGGVHFLVMELIEGEDLAQRIARGPIPHGEALRLAAQIAEALEFAHERGVVHRDLKPANVKVTPDGDVKVLDFGLAKAFQPASEPGTDFSLSPTVTGDMTRAGALLGTAAYMSPEQARGLSVDRRTDVWAFGCVLFEMLTGRRLFGGPTPSDSLAAVLQREAKLEDLPDETPPGIRRLLARCLRKEPKSRFRDMGDVRIEIEESLAKPERPSPVSAGTAPSSGRRSGIGIPVLILSLLALALAAWLRFSAPPASPGLTSRWEIRLEPELQLAIQGRSNPIAISPDGTRIVYAAERRGISTLYLRDLDSFESRAIAGTEGARNPFFSPDGAWVGFFSGNKLMKVSLEGGTPQKLCETPLDDLGASWSAAGFIVFAQYGSGLSRVPEEGGVPEAITTLDYASDEAQHRWPQVLPGDERVLFTVASKQGSRVDVVSMTGGERFSVPGLVEVSRAWAAPDGRLIYAQAGGLMGVRFDAASGEIRGNPVSVLDGVASVPDLGNAYFAIAGSGTIVYIPGGASGQTQLVWVDRNGRESPAVERLGSYMAPRISPEGDRILVSDGSEVGIRQLALFDLRRGSRTLVTPRGSMAYWSPDGKEVIYASKRAGSWNLYRAAVDGTDPGRLLLDRDREQWTGSWSPDGTVVSYYEVNPEAGRDIWILALEDGKPAPFITTPFNERSPRFSPDGQWMAYVSNESGRDEIHVVPYPRGEGKWTISTDGGSEPTWSPDGTELFYRQGDRMLKVRIEDTTSFTASRPQIIFEGRYEKEVAGNPNYDVSPDGRRFLMVKRVEASAPTRIRVILDWFAELEPARDSG